MYKLIIGQILYLASKDNDLLNDPGSLVLEELLDDVAADRTGPNDGEFRVSRHDICCLWRSMATFPYSIYSLSKVPPLSESES